MNYLESLRSMDRIIFSVSSLRMDWKRSEAKSMAPSSYEEKRNEGLVFSTEQRIPSVSHVTNDWPLSIDAMCFVLQPTFSASCSWLSPCCFLSCLTFFPSRAFASMIQKYKVWVFCIQCTLKYSFVSESNLKSVEKPWNCVIIISDKGPPPFIGTTICGAPFFSYGLAQINAAFCTTVISPAMPIPIYTIIFMAFISILSMILIAALFPMLTAIMPSMVMGMREAV